MNTTTHEGQMKQKLKTKVDAFKALELKMQAKNLPLKKTALNLVFGAGSLDPKAMFIGEAPGANEDKQGLPFVGSAGKHLERLLNLIKLTRDEVFITSIIKYRPPKNRQPTFSEIKAHTPFLADQIRIIQPKLIVTLGNFATRFILSGLDIKKMSQIKGISQIHGQAVTIEFEGRGLLVLPVYHPAALIYNPSLKEALQKDFQQINTLI